MDAEEIILAVKMEIADTLGITPDDPDFDTLMDI